MAERYNNVGNISDIFRKINSINEMSRKAQEDDFGLTKKIIKTFEQTKDGLKEVSKKDEKDFITYAMLNMIQRMMFIYIILVWLLNQINIMAYSFSQEVQTGKQKLILQIMLA